MRTTIRLAALLVGLAAFGSHAQAQAPTPPPPPPAHHGFLHYPLLRHSGATTPITGGIIGNKKSHVYHLAGDKGSLPAVQNRVYFRTEAEAQAAGYHHSGQRTMGTHSGPHRGHVPMTPMAGRR